MTLSSGQISLIVANLMGDGGYGQVGVCVGGGRGGRYDTGHRYRQKGDGMVTGV